MKFRKCPSCKKELLIDNFYKDWFKGNGLSIYCKKCARAKLKLWHINNKDKVHSYRKEYRQREYVKLKNKARFDSWIEIDIYGKKCLICGSPDKLQRHHEDYNKPLEVDILCFTCHHTLHEIRNDNLRFFS